MTTDRRFSYSQIECYAQCPRKYQLRYEHNLQPRHESQHDLRYGKAIAAAMAAYYGNQFDRVSEARKAFATSYPESQYPAQLPGWSQGKSFAGGMSALAKYDEHWAEEDTNFEVLHIEQIAIDDGEERRMVRLDRIVRDKRDGLVYGVDDKCTGKYLDSKYFAAFDPHSQIRNYVDYLQRHFGDVGGFYINALSLMHRTKAYTPRKGPDKGVQLPAGDWCDFKRMIFNPNADAIAHERASFSNWARKIQADREAGDFAYNTNHCVRGPIFCEFHPICSVGYDWPRDAMLIEQNYIQRCPRFVDGERCWLAPDHEGKHDSTPPVIEDPVIVLDDEVEEAVDA